MLGKMYKSYKEIRGAVADCEFYGDEEATISLHTLKYLESLLLKLDKQKKVKIGTSKNPQILDIIENSEI